MLTAIAKPAPKVLDYGATTGAFLQLSDFFTIDKNASPTLTCANTVLPTTMPTYHGAHWINGDITSTTSKLTIVTSEPSSGTSNQLGVGQSVSVALKCTYASDTGTVPLSISSGTLLVTIKASTAGTKPVAQPTAPVIADLTYDGVTAATFT